MRRFLGSVLAGFVLVAPALAGSAPTIHGSVAYSDVMRFDYDHTGEVNKVQFWADIDGRASRGKEGDPGYQAEEGHISRYLLDVDSGKKVQVWLEFSMTLAPNNPAAMSKISIEGNTARFETNGIQWMITDGGPGYEHDRVTVDDGVRERQPRLYGGDLVVNDVSAPHSSGN